MDAIDNNAVARADRAYGVAPATDAAAAPRWGMSWTADFLTRRSLWIFVQGMRRVLRVRTAVEPTRCSEEQMQLAYEHVVPGVCRARGHVDNATPVAARVDDGRRCAARKATP